MSTIEHKPSEHVYYPVKLYRAEMANQSDVLVIACVCGIYTTVAARPQR